ncbi:MAG: hypothetical protein MJ244_03485 [Clostridia bacterium]|nr:hypothetical protein [Clostridia bacterium]
MSKKILFYLILLVVYELIGTFFSFKLMPGEKAGLIVMLVCFLALWLGTIWLLEKDNYLVKTSKKAKAMFNYFDVDAVKELLNSKKTKGDRFELFQSNDTNQKVTVLTIKIINNDVLKKCSDEKRLKALSKLLEIVEINCEKRFGIIYNLFDDKITCLFNTIYMIDDSEFEAIKAALNISIDLMSEKHENKYLEELELSFSVCDEDMDFFIRDQRVIVNGNFELSNELVNLVGLDEVFIPERIYNKYSDYLDTDYMGKFYFNSGDVKVYKVIKVVNNEEIQTNTYNKSKVAIKNNKKFKKYIAEREREKIKG